MHSQPRTSGALLPVTLAAAISLSCASALADARIERLYVFGDSYSDGGNAYALTARPASPPYSRRYSNGPTALEQLGQLIGTPLRNSSGSLLPPDASLNFAVGGAWTSTRNNDASLNGITGLQSQIADFGARLSSRKINFDPEASLFFLAIGTNDALFGTLNGIDARAIASEAGANVKRAVQALDRYGARHIAIATIPDVSLSPRGHNLPPGDAAGVGAATSQINREFETLVDAMRSALRKDIFLVPWGLYYDLVASAPTAYGLKMLGPCATPSANGALSICPEPGSHVFWDALHPSAATHTLVAKAIAQQSRKHFVCSAHQQGHMTCRFVPGAQ